MRISKRLRQLIPLYVLLLFFLLSTIISYNHIEDRAVYPPIFSKKFPLSTPISFIASTLGMRRLAADILWIQTLQYYGSNSKDSSIMELSGRKDANQKDYPMLQEYWQQLIRIDPLFANVHIIGPTVLAWNLKRYDEAMELINEGIATLEELNYFSDGTDLQEVGEKNPLFMDQDDYFTELKWKLYTLKSVLLYFHQDKFSSAIPLLERIVFRTDSPIEIKIMLAQVYEQQNQFEKAMQLWHLVYKTAKNETRKYRAGQNIIRIQEFLPKK